MATTRTFHEFGPVELNLQNEILRENVRELLALKNTSRTLVEKMESRENIIAGIIQMIEDGGRWIFFFKHTSDLLLSCALPLVFK